MLRHGGPAICERRCDHLIRTPLVVADDEANAHVISEPSDDDERVVVGADKHRKPGVEISANHAEDPRIPITSI
jgi:hypothetical protein